MMKRSFALVMMLVVSVFVFTCDDNSTEPEDQPLGIRGKITDQNGNALADVGVHLMFPLSGNEASIQTRSRSRFLFTAQVVPMQFALEQNFPNPFNPQTVIRFQVPEESQVTLSIYDISGNLIKKFIDGVLAPGFHAVQWDGTNDAGEYVSNGLYFYRMQAGEFERERTMLLDMIDPEHIRSLDSVPLVSSDEDGKFLLPYSQIPFGLSTIITDETGPEPLGVLTISEVSLVFLKNAYQSHVRAVPMDTTRSITMDFTLQAN